MKNELYDERDLSKEGYQEGDLVSITFEDGEHWEKAYVVDNGYGRLVLRNCENEFAIAYPEKEDRIVILEKYTN